MFLFFSLAECFAYTLLNGSGRARTFPNRAYFLCDSRLDGWYRAGDQITDSCVPYGHCGTGFPGWLNGSHPTVADGAVNRSICFTSRGCCYFQLTLLFVTAEDSLFTNSNGLVFVTYVTVATDCQVLHQAKLRSVLITCAEINVDHV